MLREANCKIEPNFRDALFERNKQLQEYFYEKKILILDSSGQTLPIAGVFCNDVPKLINFVISTRNLSEDCLIRISFDGVQQSFKISASIFDPDQKSKSKEYLNSGVKKIIILAVIPNCTENYANLKTILNEIKLDSLDVYLHSIPNRQTYKYILIASNNLC